MSTTVTDEQIDALVARAKPFSLLELRWAAGRHQDGAEAIEHEHQRRMVSLREEGVIAVLFPVVSDTICGVGLITESPERSSEVFAEDPCVQAGMMTFEVLPCAAFPGDVVPG